MLRHTLPHTLRVHSRKCYRRRYTHTLYACAIRKRTHTLRMAYRSCYRMTLHTLPHVAYADMQPHMLRMRHSKEAEGGAPKEKRKKTTESKEERSEIKKKTTEYPFAYVLTYAYVSARLSVGRMYVCVSMLLYVSSYYYMCPHTVGRMCVSILLCVFIVLCGPHTAMCVLILLCVSVLILLKYYTYVYATMYESLYYRICVLILLYIYPHTTMYESSYYYVSVRILLYASSHYYASPAYYY